MNHSLWKYVRLGLVAVGLVGVLVSCNSHLLQAESPSVVVFNQPVPEVIPPPPPPPPQPQPQPPQPGAEPGVDAGMPVDLPPVQIFTPIAPPDAAVPDAPPVKVDTSETLVCPDGYVRVHVRDLWSSGVDPTLGAMTAPPLGVVVIDPTGGYNTYAARQDSAKDIDGNTPCTYYSVCIPKATGKIQLQAIGPDGCPVKDMSGPIDISSVNQSKEFWIEYAGSSASLKTDYTIYPVPIGDTKFHLTSDPTKLTKSKACEVGTPPSATPPDGYTKVHFRWPWSDPVKTGYPGSGCGDEKLGFSPPPYPSSLKVTGFNAACQMNALLEYQDGKCPWYYMMVPNSSWPTTGKGPTIIFRYPDESKGLYTPNIALPARTANEYWIAYTGAPDNTSASAAKCMDWSLQSNTYFIYTQDPGPGCAGDTVKVDPCSPPQPNGYHSVHFRYIWAGQKTFTYFPKPEFMPRWIEMEVKGPGGGGAAPMLKVICYREQDRPWFNCPVPDSYFGNGATWRAVDKTHNPEWNTVIARPFPTTPKEYWLRWYYGKPDIPRTTDPPNFKFFDYYPDGTNGDWSATGSWNDDECAAKPPANPISIGYGNGAWFPYSRTQYRYAYGGSLAYTYSDVATVQDLFNAFVWERYQLWKQNWVRDDNACGQGTAHVWSDNPVGTVSEGQGYGMAMSAAIGDKEMFDKLWLFARHYLSQNAKKYCGGLMGWMWGGPGDCRPLDTPCNPDTEGCGGNGDSAFDGDVDIAIGLVFAALQWPEYEKFATDWLVKMECEINTVYDGKWNYPSAGDTWDKTDCSGYQLTGPSRPCSYFKGTPSIVYMDYYPPGYFRVFGDYLAAKTGPDAKAANGQSHRDFWYKTAETVYELLERCYDQAGVHPALVGAKGTVDAPCASPTLGTYEELRSLWRVGIDAAWFGDNTGLPENTPGSSDHYPGKSRMQAKLDNTQDFFNNFYVKNPVDTNANRFSSICDRLNGSGTVTGCDPGFGHNSYTVNMAMCSYVSLFDAGKKTTTSIRREAVEEAISTTIQNDHYFQESLGVYSDLFLTGNFPNPVVAAGTAAANTK